MNDHEMTTLSIPDKQIAQTRQRVTGGIGESPVSFLVCVDHRPESVVALKLACIKAAKRRASITILHVIQPEASQSFLGVNETMREERVDDAQHLLSSLSRIAEDILHSPPALLLREGPIGETIIHTVDEHAEINMLVFGVAPENAARGELIAWLSTQLGERITVPMMLVPGNLDDQQIIDVS